MASVAVLLAGFGAPAILDDVEPFMRSLMGREPSPRAVEAAKERYAAIGGGSPLPGIAERIARGLESRLSLLAMSDEPGLVGRAGSDASDMRVAVGMRHSEPRIEDAVVSLASHGVGTIVWVSLSPFDAAVTTGAYREAIERAAAAIGGVRVVQATPYHLNCEFEGFFAARLVDALRAEREGGREPFVIFTAHSLPASDVASDPAYVDQLRATAADVARMSGLAEACEDPVLPGLDAFGGSGAGGGWALAFQSRGERGGEWLGPDIGDVIDTVAASGRGSAVVCPIGFATDHMETLYDLDVAAAARAREAGLAFVRIPAPNDDPRLIGSLAEAVRDVL